MSAKLRIVTWNIHKGIGTDRAYRLDRIMHVLRAVDADVVCLVRDWIPQAELCRSGMLDRVKVVRGDVRDKELLERCIGEFEIDAVFHLAAQTIVGIANRNPASTFDTNIRGTYALLEACLVTGKVVTDQLTLPIP